MPLHFSEPERLRGAHADGQVKSGIVMLCETNDITSEFLCGLPQFPGQHPAFICYNDLCMWRVYNTMLTSGYSLPEDAFLSHFSFTALWDDILDNQIRSFLLPEYLVGMTSVNLLVTRIRTGNRQRSIAVSPPSSMYKFTLGNESYFTFPWETMQDELSSVSITT